MSQASSTVSNAQTALEIAGAAAVAIPPPWGEVAAGFTGLISGVLSYFFPASSGLSPGPTLQQIIDAVAQQFATQKITQAADQITSTANVFVSQTQGVNVPLPKSVKAALTTDPQGVFSTLYTFLRDTVTGINQSALLVPITSMATDPGGDICIPDGNLQAAYLPTFAYGVSTYLLLTEFWVALAASVDGSDAVSSDINVSEPIHLLSTTALHGRNGWIAYATAASSAFSTLVQARLKQVGDAIPFSWHDDRPPFVTQFGVYFQDFGEPVPGFNPSKLVMAGDVATQRGVIRGVIGWPGNISLSRPGAAGVVFAVNNPHNTQAQTDAVQGLRNQYVSLLQQALFNNYFDPGQMALTMQGWSASLAKLQSIL